MEKTKFRTSVLIFGLIIIAMPTVVLGGNVICRCLLPNGQDAKAPWCFKQNGGCEGGGMAEVL